MRTKLTSRLSLLFMMCAVLLAGSAVAAFADQFDADADTLAVSGSGGDGSSNDFNANQQPGTTQTYPFSAAVKETGNAADNVFAASGDKVTVTNTFGGDWLNLAGSSPSSFEFTAYGVNKAGLISIKVPCDAAASTLKTMTVTLDPRASNGQTLKGDPQTVTYNITASGSPAASCTPADTTPPVISKVVTPASPDGSNGWYKSDVSVAWTVSDPQSPNSIQTTGCVDQNITTDQAATTYRCSATSAGGSAPEQSVTIKRDATAPGFNCGTADGNWHAGNVNIACTASDGGSGLADATNDASFNLSTSVAAGDENSNASTGSRTVLDNAGNSVTAPAISGNKIDRKAPGFSCDAPDGQWHAGNVSLGCNASDGGSGLTPTSDASFNLSTTVAAGNETNNASTGTKTLTDAVGNSVTAPAISGNKVDRKAPALVSDGPTASADGTNGWYKTAVTNTFTATDGGSGFAPNGALSSSFTKSSGTNEGTGVKIASGAVSDAVGNSAASIDSAAFNIDLSNPSTPTFDGGGPAAGSSHYFGSVPAEPTCSSSDAVSGLKDCVVTGYSSAVGSHTMTATATDNAGRTATATRSYTVLAWTLPGFKSPVDMGIINYAKGGSTVPLKFEVFSGSTELTSLNVVSAFTQKINCAAGAGDAIEEYSTGNTELRYDTTGGQFIFNWKTPKAPGSCYRVTMTTQDGSSIYADFQLK